MHSIETRLENINVSDFTLNCQAIRDVIDFKRAHDPAFKNLTGVVVAEKIGIGESTYKRIYNRQATDCHVSTLWGICKIYGIEPSQAMNLAPLRDIEKDKEDYNPSLMAILRRQNSEQEERIRAKDEKISALETTITNQHARESALLNQIADMAAESAANKEKLSQLDDFRTRLRRLTGWLSAACISSAAFAVLAIIFLAR